MKLSRRLRYCLVTAIAAALPSAVTAQTCAHGLSMQDLRALNDANRGDSSDAGATLHPAIARLAADVAKAYACKGAINYYANHLGLPGDFVEALSQETPTALVIQFRNKAHQDESVCGTLRYEAPLGLPGHDAGTRLGDWLNWASRPFRPTVASAAENAAYTNLVKRVHDRFIIAKGQIATTISSMIQPYLPSGKSLPRPRDEYFRSSVSALQRDLIGEFVELVERHKWSTSEIDHFVQAGACTAILPTATSPDERLLARYPSAFADYTRFKADFDAGWKQ